MLACERLMREIFLARHGETVWSKEGRRTGVLDSPLKELGEAQARAGAAAVADVGIDAIYSSPLGRAMSTAATYGVALGIPVTVLSDLHEVDLGVMGGLTNVEIERSYPGALATRAKNLFEWRFPGGESYRDTLARAKNALSCVESGGASSPLLVSHEMIGRMLLQALLGLSASDALARWHPHTTIYRIDPGAGQLRQIEFLS
jgi:probable phosphoglycerate mutase